MGKQKPVQYSSKRALDLSLALAALLLAAPLFLAIALLIRLSGRGRILYVDRRLGLGGSPLDVLKFRTMDDDADSRLGSALASSGENHSQWSERHKMENDPRVTRLGRFLRRSSLDELPQLLNVLKGDMSLVGPRPIRKEEVSKYGDKYEILKKALPGMTGLWQVSGRSELPYSRRVELDAFYVEHLSLALDLKILARTIPEVLRGRGAF